ncbi:MAG: cell surface protein [Lachnospiraceae bacterium]|nr:cell surface protein [Lachnospiraceae bacterium]
MKIMKRYVAMTLILVLLFILKLNTVTDEHSDVETFRGAQLEQSVFYPLIAKNINDEGSLSLMIDDEDFSYDANELYLNENMQVMASLEFFRDVLKTSAECYNDSEIILERNYKEYKFFLGKTAGTAAGDEVELSYTPVKNDTGYYLPLKDICEIFGYGYQWSTQKATLNITSSEETEALLPTSYDLRQKNRISEIKDQGDTQTCWAYAAFGALESGLLPEESIALDATDLIENKPYNYTDNEGGDFAMALSYLLSWKGPVAENSSKATKHVQEVHFYSTDDIDDIKWGVYLYGGVSTSIYANVSSSLGTSSYYNGKTNAYCYRGSNSANHDVVIIGWDDHYEASNFNGSVPGNGAFICQNSWGSDFGEDGVFYVSYYDSNIGYQAVSYAKIENTDNYDFVHQMDLCGWTGQIGYSKSDAWAAAVYECEEDSIIESAGFYALDKNTEYQIYVVSDYKNVNSLGTRKLVASGTLDDAGYYTIPFLDEVKVEAGDSYGVILYINTPDKDHPVAIEYKTSNMEEGSVDLTDGESYVSKNGLEWESIEETADGNLCLKAYGNYDITEDME